MSTVTTPTLIELGEYDTHLDELLAAIQNRKDRLTRTCTECGRVRKGRVRYAICRPCSIRIRAERDTWVDDVVVQRLMDGVKVDNPTYAERREATRQLMTWGTPTKGIAQRLRLKQGTVQKMMKSIKDEASK